MKEKASAAIKAAFLLLAAAFCLGMPDMVRTAAAEGISRCLYIIIPSLYAMLIVSALMIRSGLVFRAPGILTLPGRILFGMESSIFPVFTFSMFAGYPVGAGMLAAQTASGRLSRERAAVLAGLCFGAGPAFIFSCAAAQVFGDISAGAVILISSVGSNLILALLLSPFLRRLPKAADTGDKPELVLDAGLVSDCISGAGRSMAKLCFMVVAFSVLSGIFRTVGLVSAAAGIVSRLSGHSPELSQALVCSFLDITAVSALPQSGEVLLPAVCGLISFGGICVFFQLRAAAAGQFSLVPAFIIRIAAGVLSYGICRVIAPADIAGRVTAVSAVISPHAVRTHQADSAVPSVMLIIMTVVVMYQGSRSGGRSAE
ncbi:MAG: hypothetical protein IJ874_08575 [Ruminococcus sp.]|nr:hypothetical protein [Ruminococcus sp.]